MDPFPGQAVKVSMIRRLFHEIPDRSHQISTAEIFLPPTLNREGYLGHEWQLCIFPSVESANHIRDVSETLSL